MTVIVCALVKQTIFVFFERLFKVYLTAYRVVKFPLTILYNMILIGSRLNEFNKCKQTPKI